MSPSFIEVQFPVSKLSKECYKERKAGASQTLTGLGKWWGRKPLILVRAVIIGLLLPATDNPQQDRETFLKILAMDREGLWQRKTKPISLNDLWELLTPSERSQWFTSEKKWKPRTTQKQKEELHNIAFDRLSYDQKLKYCLRPEHLENLSDRAWQEINQYLQTNATNLNELVQELGKRKFGHIPRVGDAFCGGGSIPFESARIGCEAYGSDLNPVAVLLTWSALNIVGGGEEVAQQVRTAQKTVYEAVDRQITEWQIEHNEQGWRADAYLYCVETKCPACGWHIPLAPSWVIGEKTKCIAQLIPDEGKYRIQILTGVDQTAMTNAKKGTVKDSKLNCPHCHQQTPISMIRQDRKLENQTIYGLRLWENHDLVPRPDDIFQERLYCIRWVETYTDNNGKIKTRRHYCAPNAEDMQREAKVLALLQERFDEWQSKGYIPSRRIEAGDKTDEPIRTRGWTHWHHLFNPRQLLMLGTLTHESSGLLVNQNSKLFIGLILGLGRCADYNAKLSRWHSNDANEKSEQVFSNQALNTLMNYGVRTLTSLQSAFNINFTNTDYVLSGSIYPSDTRNIAYKSDYWITDPPYADAINYHELSEFFLAWYEKHIPRLFPDWYTDSKRALAITGGSASFRESMTECYRNLTNNMPDNGMQVVMFTHQDPKVWANLTLILWASGLRVTSAWCIATETDSGLKEGNYVQGTVLMVLRKQSNDDIIFLDEIYPKVELEVKRQIDTMLALEDKEEPNFCDTDYNLAAYAAALRVLTQYRHIQDIDIQYELKKPDMKDSAITQIIENAVKIAFDYLVPNNLDKLHWRELTPEERFYLKGLDIQSRGEGRIGAYQELARGFGIKEYKSFFQSLKANDTSLKTASQFARTGLSDNFGTTPTRQILFALREVTTTSDVQKGKLWLRAEIPNYWPKRLMLIAILDYLILTTQNLPHWENDLRSARLLAGALRNDSI